MGGRRRRRAPQSQLPTGRFAGTGQSAGPGLTSDNANGWIAKRGTWCLSETGCREAYYSGTAMVKTEP